MTIRLFRGRVVLSAREMQAPAHELNGMTITPMARRVFLRVPFGGVVWLWPTAVLVERDGTTTRIPIRPVTRLLLLGIMAMMPLLILAARRAAHIDKETNDGDKR